MILRRKKFVDWFLDDRWRELRNSSPMRLLLASLLLTFVHSQPTLAQDLLGELPHVQSTWKELLQEKTPISGFVVKGVVDSMDSPFTGELFALLPNQDEFGRLCLEVTSIDGKYFASAEYQISGIEPGLYQLTYPIGAKAADFLSELSVAELALLGTLGRDCTSIDRNNPIIQLRFHIVASEDTMLFVNRGSATAMEVKVQNSQNSSVISCDPVETDKKVLEYDYVCPVNLSDSDCKVEIRIDREAFGSPLPRVSREYWRC
jgi:hypothetical protein